MVPSAHLDVGVGGWRKRVCQRSETDVHLHLCIMCYVGVSGSYYATSERDNSMSLCSADT